MNLERYAYYKKAACKEYEFYSEGPKGRIRKRVFFRLAFYYNIICYNLSFGDSDEQLGGVNYHITSNNADTGKVLATVATIAIHFMDLNPDFFVHLEGSNEARTRLYQIAIDKIWNEIRGLYYLIGVFDDMLETFRRNVRYSAFFIRPARSVTLQEPKEYHYMSLSNKNDMPSGQFSEFVFIDPPASEEEARKMESVKATLRDVRPGALFLEQVEQIRQEQKKWFMLYNDAPANEVEAKERAKAREKLALLGLSEEWITKLRKVHGIIGD